MLSKFVHRALCTVYNFAFSDQSWISSVDITEQKWKAQEQKRKWRSSRFQIFFVAGILKNFSNHSFYITSAVAASSSGEHWNEMEMQMEMQIFKNKKC